MLVPLKDISKLFFPPVCCVCGQTMPDSGNMVCTQCRWEIPLTKFWNHKENPAKDKFAGNIPVENACSFFYFIHESGYRGLIHNFKYRGGWKIAQKMGAWFGEELKNSLLYKDIDVIIPIPLHLRKLLTRGYNQAEYIALGMGSAMKLRVDSSSVRRRKYTQSQTKRSKADRWDNVRGIFTIKNVDKLRGKHILLVDDVLTTGATIMSCAESIMNAVPDCRISVATLAVSRNELRLYGEFL